MAKQKSDLIDPRLTKAHEHPIRGEILSILQRGPSSPTRIADQLENVSLNLVSHHIKVLQETGCIELVETLEKRGAREHVYRTTRPRFFDPGEWEKVDPGVRRSITAMILRKISQDTAQSLLEGRFDERTDNHLSHSPLNLDEEGWARVAAILMQALEDILEANDESEKRIAVSEEEGIATRIAMMQFIVSDDD